MRQVQWEIGANPDEADIWVDHPDVSGSHCRIRRTAQGYLLEDNDSTNGTYCNGERVESSVVVTAEDDIRLAGVVALPWPVRQDAKRVSTVGYQYENDCRLADDSVSGRHAELLIDQKDNLILRDLGSSNGTWIGEQSIRAAVVNRTDLLRFGVVTATVQEVLDQAELTRPSPPPEPEPEEPKPPREITPAIMASVGIPVFVGLCGIFFMFQWFESMRPGRKGEVVAEASNSVISTQAKASATRNQDDAPETTPKLQPEPTEISDAPRKALTADNVASTPEIIEDPSPTDASKPLVPAEPNTAKPSTLEPNSGDSNVDLASTADRKTAGSNFAKAATPAESVSSTAIEPNSLSPQVHVGKAMYLIVGKDGDNEYDFASAWAAKPGLLITNAYVTESIQNSEHSFSICHVATGTRLDIKEMGQHQLYTANKQAVAKMNTAIEEQLEKLKQNKDRTAIADTLALVSQLKQELPWAERRMDAHDVGWIEIGTPLVGTELTPKQVSIQKGKDLKLASCMVEKNSLHFDEAEDRPVSLVRLKATDRVLQAETDAPVRWVSTFRSDEWEFYHFYGCPVVDLQSRLVGMYRGPRRILGRTTADTEEGKEFDMVDAAVIDQMIKQLSQRVNE